MATLDLNPTDIAQSMPLVSRDMSKLCSLCGEKRQCEHDLNRGVVSSRWLSYCPNSQTLMALLKQRRTKHSTLGGQ
jgi:hypothetical protein